MLALLGILSGATNAQNLAAHQHYPFGHPTPHPTPDAETTWHSAAPTFAPTPHPTSGTAAPTSYPTPWPTPIGDPNELYGSPHYNASNLRMNTWALNRYPHLGPGASSRWTHTMYGDANGFVDTVSSERGVDPFDAFPDRPRLVCAPGKYLGHGAGSNSNNVPSGGGTGGIGQCVLCPGGRFGGTTGLADIACSGACRAGYMCPPGSTRPDQQPCGHAGVYCPAGSSAAIAVSPGFFSTGNGGAGETTRTAQAACGSAETCVAGRRYSTRCSAGYYLRVDAGGASRAQAGKIDTSVCVPCPAGRFGRTDGLVSATCSGPCDAGFWCPAASTSAAPRSCGGDGSRMAGGAEGSEDARWYCPAGIQTPQLVAGGYYTTSTRAFRVEHTTSSDDARFATGTDAASAPVLAATLTLSVLHDDWSFVGASQRSAASGSSAGGDPSSKGVLLSVSSLAIVSDAGSVPERTANAASYTVRLMAQPTATVTVTVSNPLPDLLRVTSSDTRRVWLTNEKAAQPITLSFNPQNWHEPQRVTLSAPPGVHYNASQVTATLQHTVASADEDYNGAFDAGAWGFKPLASGTVLVQMLNSLPAGLLLSATEMALSARTTRTFDADVAHRGALNHAVAAAALPARERGAARAPALEATYQVRLSVPPTDAVTIVLSTPGATTATIEPSKVVFAAADASEAEIVSHGHLSWDSTVSVVVRVPVTTARTRSAVRRCPPGFYCRNGVRTPCPRGTYGSTFELTAASCTGRCVAGYHCPTGSKQPTPCAAGSYCEGGEVSAPCPAGRFGDRARLSAPVCTGTCAAGHFCPHGSTSPTQTPCPAGRYGATAGLGDSSCSGVCPAGHYCPVGSVTPIPCDDVTTYCPRGTGNAPLPVQAGYYATLEADTPAAATTRAMQARNVAAAEVAASGAHSHLSPQARGYYLFVAQQRCEPGSYCVGGRRLLCPAGTYGDAHGLSSAQVVVKLADGTRATTDPVATGETTTACSGLCDPGHWCEAGSTSPTQNKCPAGRYGAPIVNPSDANQKISAAHSTKSCSGPCQRGHWCPAGSTTNTQHKCPAGRFGATVGLQTEACAAGCVAGESSTCVPSVCAAGFFCREGSLQARQEECGSAAKFCPPGSATPQDVRVGYYSTPLSASPTARHGQSPCEPGYYCTGGIRRKCPAGTYGARSMLASASCSGKCSRGYYCPAGSTSSSTPRASSASASDAAGSATYRRPARRCPAGRYGAATGLKSASCSGSCDPGFYCPEASTNKRQRQCGGNGELFCPAGSRKPRRVRAGYFSTCATGGANSLLPPQHGGALHNNGCHTKTRHAQAACVAGTYCVAGRQYDCPAGRYGSSTKLRTPKCDGLCHRGFYCPPGSTSPTEYPCPKGTYGARPGLGDESCSGPCAAGYDCPAASVDQYGRPSDAGLSQAVLP